MTSSPSAVQKEPWLAVILSTIFPGFGQLYAGKIVRGVLFLLGAIALIILSLYAAIVEEVSIKIAIQLALGFVLLSFFNLFDAHRCTRRANDSEFECARKAHKDPWLAVFLSNIFPGIGQAYQGAWIAAVLFLISSLIISSLSSISPFFSIVSLALSIFCAYHAYTTSPVNRETNREGAQEIIVRVCGALIVANLLSLFLALWFRAYIFEARYIPSASMEPTLQVDDRLLIDKLTYRFSDPKRGDIIIFDAPQAALEASGSTESVAYIQRLIAFPGETVEIKEGKVFINNKALEENYIKEPMAYDLGAEVVPERSYFVLGDNRNSSSDSHVWGPLSFWNVMGKANKIFWPPARQGNIE